MLMAMRQSANNIFVKILLVAVAVCFAFWGMASWIVADSTGRHIAVVGGEKIPYSKFDARVRNYIQRLESITGKQVSENSPEYDAIRKNILRGMVQNELLNRRSKDLGIRVGDDVLMNEIANERSFADENNRFDPARFNQFLQATGQSKREFFDGLRENIRVEFLHRLFGYAPELPKGVLENVTNYRYEGRTADILPLPLSVIEADGEPSETDMIELYKENAALFFTPEYREISYVVLSPELLKKEIEVNDALLRPFYDQNVDDYYVEEMRHLVQYRFDSEEKANAAYKKITEGASAAKDGERVFAEDDSGLTDAFIKQRSDAGIFAKDELMGNFREKVFAAPEKTYVAPIASPFGWHIFYVKNIQKEHLGAFEEVKERLTQDYVQSKLEIRYPEFIGAAEDKLAEGATVESLAKDLGAEPERAALNAKGHDKKDDAIAFFEDKPEFVQSIFASDERGVPSAALPIGDGSEYAVFEVQNVLPERTKSLDEVRGRVVGLWKDIKRRRLLRDIVAAALKEHNDDAGKALEALSERFSVPIDKDAEVRRPSKNGLPQIKEYINAESAEKLFFVPVGSLAIGDNPDERLILAMHSLSDKPAAEIAGKSRIQSDKEAWRQSFSDDFLAQYFLYLEKLYGVKYNEELM